MNVVVVGALGLYAAALLLIGRRTRTKVQLEYLLAGRRLTTGPFVATLVATWYGGVLGVGEYSYRFGISNWLVMGVPYYLAALLFAFGLARRVRASAALSIPDQLTATYGPTAGRLGALLVLLLAIPGAYVLMLGELLGIYLGMSLAWAVIAGTAFTVIYVAAGGFRSVVSTNVFQFVLMYVGFIVVLPVALHAAGGFSGVWAALPAASRTWDGGLGLQAVIVWYFIAMQTLVEPTFYQRCYAAETPAVARRGVLISVGFWVLFDFLTTFTGLAARALMPHLSDPVLSYPELGRLVLPPVAEALFAVAMFATVMSTAHSYLFLAAATIGHDVAPELAARVDERRWTVAGLVLAGAAAGGLALALRSVIAIWHDVGSIVTSALLLPLVLSHAPERLRFRRQPAVIAILLTALVATGWILARSAGRYPLGVEPIFPALAISAAIWVADRTLARRRAATRPGEAEQTKGPGGASPLP
ncbi:MAG: sodium:solute symporter family protein [Acidobacteriia bacterium]|nr:sodium:solute symporter family protein [Terriglobia bacterium]